MNDVQRRRYRLLAFASTWTGCMSEVLFDSSAIVLLFITALGGSEALTMFSTGWMTRTATETSSPHAMLKERHTRPCM